MIRRVFGHLVIREESAPGASADIEQLGYSRIPEVFAPAEVEQLRAELDDAFTVDPEQGRFGADSNEYRYGMFNRSPASLAAISHPRILEVIEPLLGDDCHVTPTLRGAILRRSAVNRGIPTPVRTFLDLRECRGTTESPIRSSPSGATSCSRRSRRPKAPLRSFPGATAPVNRYRCRACTIRI